ncbi:tyrosine-type recombinase/integrase [Intestinibacter sp.]
MSYKELIEIENIYDSRQRLIAHSKYYSQLEINGLHYVNFNKDTGTISISHPNHRTHHLATSFLLKNKKYDSINTVRKDAYNIKKFLDFLSIWDIDLDNKDYDLMNLLLGFISYLMCTDERPSSNFTSSSFFYSTLNKVPLNDSALSYGKVITLGFDKHGLRDSNDWHCRSYDSSRKILSSVIKYLKFLKGYTLQYKDLALNEIPTKRVKIKYSIQAGILQEGTSIRTDLDYFLIKAGYKKVKFNAGSTSVTKVLKLEDVDALINCISSSNYQNRLLFTILKCFGLREGEASNLEVDTSKLSSKLMFLDKSDAINDIRNNLKGDIEFDKNLGENGKWVCHVKDSTLKLYDKQSKTGPRTIPLTFPGGKFEECLLYGLIEREIVMSSVKKHNKHKFLLINKGNVIEFKGEPIKGSTIIKRFTDLSKKLKDKTSRDLTDFSPHDIRHFYATHLISSNKFSVFQVSKFLGHSSTDTTIKTYYHFIDVNTLDDDETINIYNKYKEMKGKLNGVNLD